MGQTFTVKEVRTSVIMSLRVQTTPAFCVGREDNQLCGEDPVISARAHSGLIQQFPGL